MNATTQTKVAADAAIAVMGPAEWVKAELDRLSSALKLLWLRDPMLAAAVKILKWMVSREPCIAATDGVGLYLNLEGTQSFSLTELVTLLAHEGCHVILKHAERILGRDPALYNVAGDIAINRLLSKAGYAMPRDAVLDLPSNRKVPENASTEEIYAMLVEDNIAPSVQYPRNPGNLPSGETPGKLKSPGQIESEESRETEPRGAGGEKITEGEEQGSTLPKPSYGMGDVWPMGEGYDNSRASADILAVMPSLLEGLALPTLERVMGDYQSDDDRHHRAAMEFASLIRTAVSGMLDGEGDFTLIPPDRRMLWHECILPSLQGSETGDVVIAVDTSGSVGAEKLQVVASIVSAVVQEWPVRVGLVCGGMDPESIEYPVVDVKIPNTGGGTQFSPIIYAIEERRREEINGIKWAPACIVYITDCYLDDGGVDYRRCREASNIPVLWVCHGRKESHYYNEPSYGRVVHFNLNALVD